jgi:hypothetical protein
VATTWFNRDHFWAAVTFSTGFSAFHACEARVPGSSFKRMVEEPILLHRAIAVRDMSAATLVSFDRSELNHILTLYGRMVSAGEWRDYALDFLDEVAVFSIFRRTSEMALFRIEKRPRLRGRQGQYSVVAAGGVILKRGHELALVLKIFDKKLLKALATKE